MSTHAQANAPFNLVVLGASIAGLVVSVGIVLYMLNAQGHAAFNTNNDGVSWGLPIATYVFFVLTSTGLTFVASLAMVFNLKGFYPVVKRVVWLAVATLLGGFACLAFELGHPFRMLWAIPLSFQVTSPMNWMGVFYSLYLLLLLLKFHRDERQRLGQRVEPQAGHRCAGGRNTGTWESRRDLRDAGDATGLV